MCGWARVGVCGEQARSALGVLTFCMGVLIQCRIPGVFMMSTHSTKAALPLELGHGMFAKNRYGIMQSGWVIGGVMLVALVLAGLGLAAWMFPGWWRALSPRVTGVNQRSPTSDAQRPKAAWQLGLALVLVPTALVGVWSAWQPHRLDAFEEQLTPANAQVAQLLAGEHLVPPPPLPPEVFLAQEIVAAQPLLASADRRWQQMDADFVQAVLRVFQVMKTSHGYDMALLEGWRSPQRQALLAARGASVTQAGPWQSYHQWGLAADCAFMRDGRLVISERDPWARDGYALFGQVAEQMGLTWGGRWQMSDLGHIEWRKPGVQAAMRNMPR